MQRQHRDPSFLPAWPLRAISALPQLRAGVEEVFAELDELCLDEPQTPKYLAQMVKKINFRSVRPHAAESCGLA